ncbi:hypothetical protein J3Q64DRAFT_1839048 [Phycomyces blakesleeanus]|uniref:Uncharacterized protein n=1 Tax=Phycomyces blakesleeanus TaxID=4837 RepID=A0ABR3AQF9_PHYBL
MLRGNVGKINDMHCRRGMLLAWETMISNEYNEDKYPLITGTTHHDKLPDKPTEQTDLPVLGTMTWPKARPAHNTWVLGARFPKEPGGTTLVPRDTSFGQLTIDVDAHESGTARHSSPPDQTTEGIHRPVFLTRNWPKPHIFTKHVTEQLRRNSSAGRALD